MKLRTTACEPSEVVSGSDEREEEVKVEETMARSPTFASLLSEVDLDVRLRKAVARLGYIRPTLVQTQCIRLAINSGRDLLVRARTGSGKTLAYCLPVLHKILIEHKDGGHPSTHHHARGRSVGGDDGSGSSSIKAVILVPTRELCEQVHSVLQKLIYYCDEVISIAVLGATSSKGSSGSKSTISSSTKSNRSFLVAQEAMLRDNPNVIVATPAALLRYIAPTNTTASSSKSSSSAITVSLKKVSSLVIDEADLVLSFGYSLQQDILQIIKALPNIYQGYLMSATLTPDIQALKKVVLHSPAILKLEEGDDDPKRTKGGKKLAQFYLSIPKNDKELVLYVFLKLGILKGKGLFFVNSTDGGYRLKLFLEQFHIRSSVLNAELPLLSRMSIIDQFNAGNFDYLIATDESSTMMKKKIPTTSASREGDDDHNENGEQDEGEEPVKAQKSSKVSKRTKDEHYGVSRGVDFQGVSFVVNVDLPLSADSYTHRIGRTARGGSKGVALSLVECESEEQRHALTLIQASQPPISLATAAGAASSADGALTPATTNTTKEETYANPPLPLDFDLNEIEGFRYRVEDVRRAVTSIAVKEARAAELKAELLNSESLQSHFAINPADLQLLRHDRQATHVTRIQDHLKHVPKYLLPSGMQVSSMSNSKKKRKRARGGTVGGKVAPHSSHTDPLKKALAGSSSVTLDGVIDVRNAEEEMTAELSASNRRGGQKRTIYMDDEFGRSTSGRDAWKQRHKKGKYSTKRRKKERT